MNVMILPTNLPPKKDAIQLTIRHVMLTPPPMNFFLFGLAYTKSELRIYIFCNKYAIKNKNVRKSNLYMMLQNCMLALCMALWFY